MKEDLRKELLKDIPAGRVTRGSEILNAKRVTPQVPPRFQSERQDRGAVNFEIIKVEK